MADRNVSRRQDEKNSPTIDHEPPCVPQSDVTRASHSQLSTNREPNTTGHDSEQRASNPDLSHSPSLRPGSATRDSGYNTDVSPATTISPATNTPRQQQHFVFDDLDHSRTDTREQEGRVPSLTFDSTTPPLGGSNVATSPLAQISYPPNQEAFDQRYIPSRSTPPLRLSPDIFKASPTLSGTGCRKPQTPSSRPLSEASDTNRIQFDFESDNDEDDSSKNVDSTSTPRFPLAPPPRPSGHFDQSGNLLDFHLPDLSDDDDDEDVFYKHGDILKHWGVSSEPQTPRYRSGSLSLRQRRYCSATDEESLLGACGGSDVGEEALYFGADTTHDQRSHSFSGSRRGRNGAQCPDVRQVVSGSILSTHHSASGAGRNFESSLTCSQGFQPGYFDTSDSRSNDSENVFTFDDIDGDEDKDNQMSSAPQRAASAVPIVREKPPQSPASRARRRRVGVATHLRLSNGFLLPWSSSIGGVSVSTQTPHMTSVMIQQILETPVPLPNEARGTAASRLRRMSESGVPLPPSPVPLPDIVPRDRSLSVPDFQALARRQRAREVGRQVGRELRRLSDEFNFTFTRRNLSPVHEEFNGHPASFPQMRPTRLRNPLSHFGAFIRETFGGRRSSSVDIADQQLATLQHDERSEEQQED